MKIIRRLMCVGPLLVALCAPTAATAALIGDLDLLSPISRSFVESVDFTTFADNGNAALGSVTAALQIVDPNSTTAGCEAADFAGFAAGSIALIRRGTCTYATKVINAAAAGAFGALIFDSVVEPLPAVLFPDPTSIPALFLTQSAGSFLTQIPGSVVRMEVTRAPAQIPAPGTFALMGIALAIGGFSRRKRLSI